MNVFLPLVVWAYNGIIGLDHKQKYGIFGLFVFYLLTIVGGFVVYTTLGALVKTDTSLLMPGRNGTNSSVPVLDSEKALKELREQYEVKLEQSKVESSLLTVESSCLFTFFFRFEWVSWKITWNKSAI